MKKIFLLSFFTFLSLLSFAQIVGGGGFCAVAGNPNSFAVLNVVDSRFSCTNVKDTVTGNIYTYVVSNAIGSRWVLVNNSVQDNAAFWKLNGNGGTTAGTNFLGTTDAQDLVFKTNAIERMRFTGGNIGINTALPTSLLHMNTNSGYYGYINPTIKFDYTNITFCRQSMNANWEYQIDNPINDPFKDGGIRITAKNGYGIKVDSGNRVGIGTIYPQYNLDVVNQTRIGAQGGLDYTIIQGGSGYGSQIKQFYADGSIKNWFNGNGNNYINGGYLGLNKINPSYQLDVNGDASATRLRYTQNVQYANPVGASGSATDASVLVRDKTTGFIGETNLYPLVAWNNGNTGPLSIGTKDNNSLTFMTNNTTAATISTAGDLVLNNKLNLVNFTHHNMVAADWGWSNILMRNQTTGNVETTTTYDIVKGVGLLQTDTVIAWPSRNVVLGGLAHDVFINGRIGTQNSTDSIVFNLPASPVYGQEINFYVQKNAKLWTMDIILDCGATNGILFDEGNGLATNFAANKTRKCFEFGASANNSAYTGDLLPVNTGKSFKITCNYNHLDKLWTVTNVINQ